MIKILYAYMKFSKNKFLKCKIASHYIPLADLHLYLLNSGITSLCHHNWFMLCWGMNLELPA